MARSGSWWSREMVLLAMLVLVAHSVAGVIDAEDEAVGNEVSRDQEEMPWDLYDSDMLRKILYQIEADERMAYAPRAIRAWSSGQRSWVVGGPRPFDPRAARQGRTDKRQVRFRQCYFNPISCFRK